MSFFSLSPSLFVSQQLQTWRQCEPWRLYPVKYNIYRICMTLYEGHRESKERFAIQRYLLIIGKKKNMQVL